MSVVYPLFQLQVSRLLTFVRSCNVATSLRYSDYFYESQSYCLRNVIKHRKLIYICLTVTSAHCPGLLSSVLSASCFSNRTSVALLSPWCPSLSASVCPPSSWSQWAATPAGRHTRGTTGLSSLPPGWSTTWPTALVRSNLSNLYWPLCWPPGCLTLRATPMPGTTSCRSWGTSAGASSWTASARTLW